MIYRNDCYGLQDIHFIYKSFIQIDCTLIFKLLILNTLMKSTFVIDLSVRYANYVNGQYNVGLLDYMQAESGRPYYWQALIDDLDIIVSLFKLIQFM